MCKYIIEKIEYVEGLNSKVKLGLYKAFSKEVRVQKAPPWG